MKKSIVKEVKQEVAAKKAADKQPKSIKLTTLILITVSMTIGGIIGIYGYKTVNTYINNQVQSQVKSYLNDQLK